MRERHFRPLLFAGSSPTGDNALARALLLALSACVPGVEPQDGSTFRAD
jgi:hypothetical protein